MNPANEPLLVNFTDAMRILALSRSRLFQYVKDGKIKKVKDGGRTLFSYDELRRFAAQLEGR